MLRILSIVKFQKTGVFASVLLHLYVVEIQVLNTVPETVEVPEQRNECLVLCPQAYPQFPYDPVLHLAIQFNTVPYSRIIFILQRRPQGEQRVSGQALETEYAWAVVSMEEQILHAVKDLVHSLLRRRIGDIFRQDLIDHVGAVCIVLVGQLVNFLDHLVAENQRIDILARPGHPLILISITLYSDY